MKHLFRRGFFLAALVATAAFVGCGSTESAWSDKPGPKVLASFPPLACFATNVAGDDAQVRTLMTSQGPHHFDPRPADHKLLAGADVFLLNGLTLDPKAAEMPGKAGNSKVKAVVLGDRIPKKELEENCHCHDGGDHVHTTDPHVWLGPDLAAIQVEGIRDALKEADPARAADYDRRAAAYTETLKKLKADGLEMLKDKQDRKIVTFHEALSYFAKAYKLDIVEVIQKVPGQEPAPKDLEALLDACVKGKVRVIAVEPQYAGQQSARRIVDELKRRGVEDPVLVEMDPLETADPADLTAGWYEAKMRANLAALAKALK